MKQAIILFAIFGLVLCQQSSYTPDTRVLTGTLYDVWPCGSDGQTYTCGSRLNTNEPKPICFTNPSQWECAVDFERAIGDDLNIVNYLLDTTNRVPTLKNANHPTVNSASQFPKWYQYDPQFNIPFVYNLTLSNSGTGSSLVYTYSNQNFFPLDGRGFGSQYRKDNTPRNFGFSFAYNGRFTYQGNEYFKFRGDDDLFVYINDRLAINLGGVHTAQDANIDLSWPSGGCPLSSYPSVACATSQGLYTTHPCACLLGLKAPVNGNSYAIDVFYNERHTTESTMAFTTSLYIQCPYYDWCSVCQGDGQSCCGTRCNDNNPCTTEQCDQFNGTCLYTPVSCPAPADKCKTASCSRTNGACVQSDINCTPANPSSCFNYGCDSASGCKVTAKVCNDNDPCTDDTCDPSTPSGCVFTPKNCNDNNLCTTDKCVAGQCTYTSISCTGGNACTNNTCDPKTGCSNANITSTCLSGNKCRNEGCDTVNGCYSTAITCNDNNACTTDSCNPATGCVFSPITCNDNNVCTEDSCNAQSGCKFNTIPCLPKDHCFTASCGNITGCVQTPVNCDDNNACTDDFCIGTSGCGHTAVICNDNNPCTADSCNPASGCVYTDINFDDGDACTTEVCTKEDGLKKGVVVCDDKDVCTIDTCNSASGCVYTPRECDACTGKPECTTSDPCLIAACAINHPGVVDGECYTYPIDCDDGDYCTTDSCEAGECKHTPVDCSVGSDKCHVRSCDPSNGNCIFSNVTCNDNNACTTDSCDLDTGSCVFTPVSCPYSDFCSPQSCVAGSCVVTNVTCNDNNKCTVDSCATQVSDYECVFEAVSCDNSDPCNPQSCDLATGSCATHPVNCDDNNKCTVDSCTHDGTTATCKHESVVCDTSDQCHPYSCSADTGLCVQSDFDCSSGNPCSTGKCVVENGAPTCEFIAKTCSGDVCNPFECNSDSGECEPVEPLACDDGNACTNDLCRATRGCFYEPRDCDDGNACTVDTCDTLLGCVHTTLSCDDNNVCTNDTCNPSSGCNNTAFELPIGNKCLGIFCDPKLGVIQTPTKCPSACTAGCDPVEGCLACPKDEPPISVAAAAGIGAGAIAGVTIGVVAGVAALSYAGKKGYEKMVKNKVAQSTVNDNPLYENADTTTENPMFEQ